MRDLGNNLAPVVSLLPQLASGSGTTTNSTGVDLVGFEGALMVLSAGAEGDTLSGSLYYTVKLQDSADNSAWADVVDADVTDVTLASGVWLTLDAAADVSQSYGIGYIGGKQYVRANIVRTGNHATGTPLSVVVIKGYPHHAGGASS
jgi:hypothetical protein